MSRAARDPRPRPLASLSPNIVAPASSPPVLTKLAANVVAPLQMENRVTQFGDGSDTHTGSFEVLGDGSSDSTFELRMLMEMRAEREAIETRRVPRKAFSRANKPKRTLTAEHLQRNPQPEINTGVASRSGGGYVGHEEREPQISVPSSFGTKGRLNQSFMDRYKFLRRDQISPVEPSDLTEWETAGGLPLADDSPLSRKSSARGTPATGQRVKGVSTDQVLSWDVSPDFSGNSLLASTPAVPRRTLEEVRKAETAARALLDPDQPAARRNLRLDEVREAEIEAAKEAGDYVSPLQKPTASTRPRAIIPKLSKETNRTQPPLSPAPPLSLESSSLTPARTGPNQPDSRDLLRMLSRSVSNTPSPPNGSAGKRAVGKKETLANAEVIAPSAATKPAQTLSPRKPFSRASVRPQQQHVKAPRLVPPKTPVVTGAFPDTPVAEKAAKQETAIAEELPRSDRLRPPLEHSPPRKQDRKQIPKPVEPELPQSALSAVIGKAKVDKSEGVMGESTIRSLEGLTDPGDSEEADISVSQMPLPLLAGMRPTEEDRRAIREILEQRMTAELPFAGVLPANTEDRRSIRDIVTQRMARGAKAMFRKTEDKSIKSEGGVSGEDSDPERDPMTPRRKERLMEDIQLQRMSEQVSSMHSRSKSLNKSLNRLETQLSKVSGCRHCGCPGDCYGSNPWYALGQSTLRLFYQDHGGKKRLTWLSWALILLLLWLISEVLLCYNLCRPMFADWVEDDFFERYADSPDPPFVTATILFGPFWKLIRWPVNLLIAFFTWMWGLAVYVLESDVAEEGLKKASQFVTTATTRFAAESLVPEGVDWSMEADEYL